MNSSAICPISSQKVDENVARLNGAFTVLILAIFVYYQISILILILLLDFTLRSFELSNYSPLAITSKYIVEKLNIKKRIINAGPKIFASRIGVVFNLAIAFSYLLGFVNTSIIIVGIFAFCAFLEAAFGFCVACKIYPFVYKLTNKTTVVTN